MISSKRSIAIILMSSRPSTVVMPALPSLNCSLHFIAISHGSPHSHFLPPPSAIVLAGPMSCKLVGQFLAATPALLNFRKVSCPGRLLAQRPFPLRIGATFQCKLQHRLCAKQRLVAEQLHELCSIAA